MRIKQLIAAEELGKNLELDRIEISGRATIWLSDDADRIISGSKRRFLSYGICRMQSVHFDNVAAVTRAVRALRKRSTGRGVRVRTHSPHQEVGQYGGPRLARLGVHTGI